MVRKGRLYHFNVTHGLTDVGLEEYRAVNKIAAVTNNYLDDPDIAEMVQACVDKLRSGGQRSGLRKCRRSVCLNCSTANINSLAGS